MTDYQRVKIQEIEEKDLKILHPSNYPKGAEPAPGLEGLLSSEGSYNPRVPRSFDIEVRGSHLVDTCVAGDIVVCIGEVKMMQV